MIVWAEHNFVLCNICQKTCEFTMLVLRIIFIIVDKAGIATEGASESGSWSARLLRGNTQIDWNQLTRMMPQADSWRCPRGPSLVQWHEAHPSLSQVQIRLQRMCVYVCAQCVGSTNNHWYATCYIALLIRSQIMEYPLLPLFSWMATVSILVWSIQQNKTYQGRFKYWTMFFAKIFKNFHGKIHILVKKKTFNSNFS